MKKLLPSLLLIPVLLFTSCKDNESTPPSATEEDLIGAWTGAIGDYEIFINDQSLADFFGSQQAAEFFLGFLDFSEDDITSATGSVEFLSNNTYIASSPDTPDSETEGTWEIRQNGTVLVLDEGTSNEASLEVVSISESQLVFKLEQSQPTDDLNFDGQDDTVTVTGEIILTK